MEFKFQKRKGIGNVITTLIVLIASVVLGAGVIFFGSSLFSTNTQSEEVRVSNAHIWAANNNTSTVAFAIQNTGGKPISITAMSVRGISVPLTYWYYNKVDATATNIQRELTADYNPTNGIQLDSDAPMETMTQAQGPISLNQGEAAFVFMNNPNAVTDGITPAKIKAIDSGIAMTVSIKTGQAEAVQSVSVVLE